ncbi:MAG: hypothetical protein KC483_05435 [Nitrosarchaeum sp.]|nr:hypothetical protein [Nitrosarchaeum sp.]MCA9819482.1 hypothetical protein [Nitrosarchaeum sp.]
MKSKVSEERPDTIKVRSDAPSAKFLWFAQTSDVHAAVAFCVLLPEQTSLANYFTKGKMNQDTSKARYAGVRLL